MNAPRPVIELRHVGFFYQLRKGYFSTEEHWALRDVSFTLYQGESLGIIGRNGAGKSTLLRLLAGIVAADRGQIINHGYTTSLLSLQAGFIPYLTGRENALLGGLLLGLPRRTLLQRMDQIKEFSGLGDYFEQPISSYSTGMAARLGFSIAFEVDPDVLLIDEVLGVGDEEFRKKSTDRMLQRIRSDRTVIIVTHLPGLIREVCDRAVIIEGGQSVLEGTPDAVYQRYHEILAQTNPACGC